MPYKRIKRYAKKLYARGSKLLKPYHTRSGMPKLAPILRDVRLLKSMVNAEKKDIEYLYSAELGQTNIDAAGHVHLGSTPFPIQGTGSNERTGSSIKVHSSIFQITGQAQANAVNRIKAKYYVVHILGTPITASDPTLQFLDDGGWLATTGIRDTSSPRHQDYYPNFKVIAQGSFVVPPTIDGSPRMFNKTIRIKYNDGNGHHVRWIKDTNTLATGQLELIIVADTGNINSGTPCTLAGNYNQAVSTGADMLIKMRHFYYDN